MKGTERRVHRILPVIRFLVNEDPRVGDERVDIQGIVWDQHTVPDSLALVIDPIQHDIVLRSVDELNEGPVIVVDRTKQHLILLLLLRLAMLRMEMVMMMMMMMILAHL